MRRLPAPCGLGTVWVVREDGGIWQPRAMPEVVENQAAGVFGCFSMDGEGFPGRTLCWGDSWKRHGRGVEDEDDDKPCEEGDFQG